MSTQHRFQVADIPDGSPGKRLDAAGINYPDLDVYTCSDRYSNDAASVNITACELTQHEKKHGNMQSIQFGAHFPL